MRCRNHSRATKIGQRMWKRNALCSKGVPCRSRMRNRIKPASASSTSSRRRAKLTGAALTTERSSAIDASRRTKPWSRTGIELSSITSVVTATPARLARSSDSASDLLSVGTSGWSYPSWRPGFYPAGLANEDFLGFYAQRFRTVELNTTGYRLSSEEQFARWAEQAPAGFVFAPKLPQRSLRSLGTFEERVSRLGERLGPVRVVVESPRDDGLLALLLGSTDLRLALDLRDPSWDEVD